MGKKLFYILLVLLSLLIIVFSIGIRKFNTVLFKEKPNYLTYTSEEKAIEFRWVDDSIGNYVETKAAIIIPLKIKGLSHKFYMQFDTGSPFTYIYGKDVESLKKMGLGFNIIVKDEVSYIENHEFVLGKNQINASMIKILDNYGNSFDKNDTISNIKIGTLGSDFLDNYITAIDFKNQNIQFYTERPDWMLNLSNFQSFDFKGRRIYAADQNKQQEVRAVL